VSSDFKKSCVISGKVAENVPVNGLFPSPKSTGISLNTQCYAFGYNWYTFLSSLKIILMKTAFYKPFRTVGFGSPGTHIVLILISYHRIKNTINMDKGTILKAKIKYAFS